MKQKKNTITKDHVEKLLHSSKFTYSTQFGKCTIVSCQLPNGFVITESSSCVDPENYDEKLGYDICIKKITDKIWELEGYCLQCELYRKKNPLLLEEAKIGELMDLGYQIELDTFTSEQIGKIVIRGGAK